MTTIELIANFSYIVSAALFIFGLKMLIENLMLIFGGKSMKFKF